MARVFVYEEREFTDPDPSQTIEEIKAVLSNYFPEVVNAEVVETRRGEDTLYEFKKRVGVKGGSPTSGEMVFG